MKAGMLILMVTLLYGCSWARVKVAGDEYLLSPFPPGKTMTVPTSTSGSASATAASTQVSSKIILKKPLTLIKAPVL